MFQGPGLVIYSITGLHGRLTGFRLLYTEFSTCFTEFSTCFAELDPHIDLI